VHGALDRHDATSKALVDIAEGTAAIRDIADYDADARSGAAELVPLFSLQPGDRIIGTRDPNGSNDFFDYGAIATLRYKPQRMSPDIWHLTIRDVEPGHVRLGPTIVTPHRSAAWRLPDEESR
jgi:hypothetical protein